jgi:choline dehydrogenase-like flavoprotein
MPNLATPVEELLAEQNQESRTLIDTIVVGSGYGGAVAALRCAEAGLATCVLERGNEYHPGDFPRDAADSPAHFRINGTGDTTGGYDDALFDLHVSAQTAVLVGNGLGGGSLINANVALRPDARVFKQKEWPKSIREGELDRYFDVALEHLHARPYESPGSSTPPPKTIAFDAFAKAARKASDVAAITVNSQSSPTCVPRGTLQPCIGCGDCVSGCNYGAKATLATTYLAQAYESGARLFTNATVLCVSRHEDKWRVHFVRTANYRRYQRALACLRHAKDDAEGVRDLPGALEHVFEARNVILAAGALGSTEILKRSEKHGLPLSSCRLGTRFSGNGDYLSFGYGQKRQVDAVGWGATGSRCRPQPVVGPTITRVAHFRDDTDVTKSFVVQDASVPGALADIFHELVTTDSILPRLDHFRSRGPGNGHEIDPIARVPAGRTHTQILLTIGHDDSGGELRLADNDRICVAWESLKVNNPFERYDAMQKDAVEALGGYYLGNPAWTPIPKSVESVLNGAKFRGRDLIVHPLGGCPMADDAAAGVVNDVGAVFSGRTGTQVHRGLYVLDGSIIPTSLGANPLLTITALAERAAAIVAKTASETRARGVRRNVPMQPPLPDLPTPALGRRLPVELREIMRGELRAIDGSRFAATLEVRFPTQDVQSFLGNPRFEDAEASLQLSALGPGRSIVATTRYPLAKGTVTILEPVRTSFLQHLRDTALVLLTWFIERGLTEIIEGIRNRGRRKRQGPGILKLIMGTLRMAWHAADRRCMQYAFRMVRATEEVPRQLALLPEHLGFEGRKDVFYAADWPALRSYMRARLHDFRNRILRRDGTAAPARSEPRRLARRNLWASMTELDVRLYDHRADEIAGGRIEMAPVEMLDEEHAPRVVGETTTGLLGLVGYPLLFARYLLKCRVWDFRLPSYEAMAKNTHARQPTGDIADLVNPDQHLPRLRNGVEPVAYRLEVPLRLASSEKNISLVLWRYRNKLTSDETFDRMIQCKSILLVHAFAQSALSFAEPTLKPNFAEFLHEKGWDVWLIEHRLSIALPAAEVKSTMDEIAAIDIPAAVDACLSRLREELSPSTGLPLQIYALAQCVGSAALAMSILSGRLAYDRFIPYIAPPVPGFHQEPRQMSKLAGVVFSQFTPYVIGGAGSQFRSFLPTTLRDVFGLGGFNFAASAGKPPGVQEDGEDSFAKQTETLIDRFLATYPIADKERCFGEEQGVGATQVQASCRRMAGVAAPLFSHANLSRETHDRLPLLLGTANIDVFVHARKCVDAERLVNADGLNVYVTQYNIQTHLHMPVAFLHGLENELFSIGSSRRSYLMISQCFTPRHVNDRLHLIVIPKYGHLDWLIGNRAHAETYPKVGAFFDSAWATNKDESAVKLLAKSAAVADERPSTGVVKAPETANFMVALPAMGPLIGHVRQEDNHLVANVFIRPQEMTSTLPVGVVADYTVDGKRVVTLFSGRNEVVPLPERQYGELTPDRGGRGPYAEWFDLRYAVCPIKIPLAHLPATGAPLQVDTYVVRLLPTHTGFPKSVIGNESPTGLPLTDVKTADALSERDLLATALTEQNYRRLDEAISRARSNVRSIDYRRQRTLRSTLSQLRLRKRAVEDSRCELRRHWMVSASGATVNVLATCCRYPGLLVEQHRVDETFARILAGPLNAEPLATPSALFLLGDQVYADATAGFFDMTTPIEKFDARYEDFLSSANVRRVTARIPTYMCIDDHEISDNWDTTQRNMDRPLADMAFSTARVHQWAHSSAAHVVAGRSLGRTPAVGFLHKSLAAGVIPTIVLDTRTHRTLRYGHTSLLNAKTWKLLKAWLKRHGTSETPKIIASSSPIAPGFARFLGNGQHLDPNKAASADNWQGFNEERLQLFRYIAERGIKGVVFLSGDYHCCGIASVNYRGQRLATAIVVPPAYAPLAYANAKASELADSEMLGEFEIKLTRFASGEAARADGSGFAHLAFTPNARGGWTLRTTFDICDVCAGTDITSNANWRQYQHVAHLGADDTAMLPDASATHVHQ